MTNSNSVYFGDNLAVLQSLKDSIVDLVYIDPPFHTNKKRSQQRTHLHKSYGEKLEYNDKFDNYCEFMKPRLLELWRTMKDTATIYVHLDYRECHYVKVMMDELFGRDKFLGEVIWSYDYGGRSKKKWSPKHDNILIYVKDPNNYTFRYEDIDRVPYMAPSLQSKERQELGKPVTSSWFITVEPTMSKRRTGYPTQKPYKLLQRIIKVSSNPGDLVLDCFAGSGTTGDVAYDLGRNFTLIDSNQQAIEVMRKRFAEKNVEFIERYHHV